MVVVAVIQSTAPGFSGFHSEITLVFLSADSFGRVSERLLAFPLVADYCSWLITLSPV